MKWIFRLQGQECGNMHNRSRCKTGFREGMEALQACWQGTTYSPYKSKGEELEFQKLLQESANGTENLPPFSIASKSKGSLCFM